MLISHNDFVHCYILVTYTAKYMYNQIHVVTYNSAVLVQTLPGFDFTFSCGTKSMHSSYKQITLSNLNILNIQIKTKHVMYDFGSEKVISMLKVIHKGPYGHHTRFSPRTIPCLGIHLVIDYISFLKFVTNQECNMHETNSYTA